MRNKIQKTLAGAAALALILATLALVSGKRTIYGNPLCDIPLNMPDTLGAYHGEELWFCQNDQCGRSFKKSDLETALANAAAEAAATNTTTAATAAAFPPPCISCNGELSLISIGEMRLLPDNTPIFRKEYSLDGKNPLVATVVFSGIERRSIHRPQICLVSQGNRITNERPMEFDIGRGQKITLRILEISQEYGNPNGGKIVSNGIYAYWLFNPEYETDSHTDRFLRMSVDNAMRNYRPRWGYAAISIMRNPSAPDAWKTQLAEFIRLFYPIITQVREDMDAQRNVAITLDGHSRKLNTPTDAAVPTSMNPERRAKLLDDAAKKNTEQQDTTKQDADATKQ